MKLAIGFFDGVHVGHRAILKGADSAITFSNHPLSILDSSRAPSLIMREEDRFAAIRDCGVGHLEILDFTRALASLEPEDFAARCLSRDATIRCGANWRFGKGGRGDAELLRKLGFDVEVVLYSLVDAERVSSSRIRAALVSGRISAANEMLARRFSLVCRPEKGKGLGSKMGCPTLNLVPLAPTSPGARLVELPYGVYKVEVSGRRALANWGLAPTMGEQAWRSPVLEVHFRDGEPPAFADRARVDFIDFIRPERKFDSIAALLSQISKDIANAF